MSAAVLRLESFTQPRAMEADPGLLEDERKLAFDEGYAQGRQVSIEDLAAQLRALNATLEFNETQAAQLHQQMLHDMGIVLTAIVDVLGNASQNDRLCQAIADELRRMVDSAPLRRPLVRCDPSLVPLAEQAVAASGVDRVQLEGDPGMAGSAELIFDSARTVLAPDAITQSLRALISELTEE